MHSIDTYSILEVKTLTIQHKIYCSGKTRKKHVHQEHNFQIPDMKILASKMFPPSLIRELSMFILLNYLSNSTTTTSVINPRKMFQTFQFSW